MFSDGGGLGDDLLVDLDACHWQSEALALLDERHLVAWSASESERAAFAASLTQYLGSQPDTGVITLYGREIRGLDDFCHQLERSIPVHRLLRRVDGPDGVTEALRSRRSFGVRPVGRQRYIIWNEADALLDASPELHADLVDALLGVSAEMEYASDDVLMIQRVLFVGGERLREAASAPGGAFRAWRSVSGELPFWRVVTGVERPPLLSLPVSRVMSGEPILANRIDNELAMDRRLA